MAQKKALILLSGGLDSATSLALAKIEGYELYAMSFAYGQRSVLELEAAKVIAKKYGVKDHKVVTIDLRAFGGSALTDDIDVPKGRNDEEIADGIPVTYVPARNTIFLSFALGWAEILGVFDIFIGANSIDYSGYPDCRKEYLNAFEKMANLACAASVEGKGKFTIHAPLLTKTKAEIIRVGLDLGVDYSMTRSCYDLNEHGESCGKCDSCTLRLKGFKANNMQDPAPYVKAVA